MAGTFFFKKLPGQGRGIGEVAAAHDGIHPGGNLIDEGGKIGGGRIVAFKHGYLEALAFGVFLHGSHHVHGKFVIGIDDGNLFGLGIEFLQEIDGAGEIAAGRGESLIDQGEALFVSGIRGRAGGDHDFLILLGNDRGGIR